MIGSLAAVALFPRLHKEPVVALGRGAEDAIMPLDQYRCRYRLWRRGGTYQRFRPGFAGMSDGFRPATTGIPVCRIQRNLSAGRFFQWRPANFYADHVMLITWLWASNHETCCTDLAAIISGGFDSLPHCGAIVAILTITSQTHKQAYKNMAMVTVVFPVIAALVLLGVVAVTG